MSYEEEDTCHRSIEVDRYTSIELDRPLERDV
jgi:hypothetical protein